MPVGQYCASLLSLTLLCFHVHCLWESGVWSFTCLTDPFSSSLQSLVLIGSRGRLSCPESVCLGSLEDCCLPHFLRYCISSPLMQGTQSPLKPLTFPLALGPQYPPIPAAPNPTTISGFCRLTAGFSVLITILSNALGECPDFPSAKHGPSIGFEGTQSRLT